MLYETQIRNNWLCILTEELTEDIIFHLPFNILGKTDENAMLLRSKDILFVKYSSCNQKIAQICEPSELEAIMLYSTPV